MQFFVCLVGGLFFVGWFFWWVWYLRFFEASGTFPLGLISSFLCTFPLPPLVSRDWLRVAHQRERECRHLRIHFFHAAPCLCWLSLGNWVFSCIESLLCPFPQFFKIPSKGLDIQSFVPFLVSVGLEKLILFLSFVLFLLLYFFPASFFLWVPPSPLCSILWIVVSCYPRCSLPLQLPSPPTCTTDFGSITPAGWDFFAITGEWGCPWPQCGTLGFGWRMMGAQVVSPKPDPVLLSVCSGKA